MWTFLTYSQMCFQYPTNKCKQDLTLNVVSMEFVFSLQEHNFVSEKLKTKYDLLNKICTKNKLMECSSSIKQNFVIVQTSYLMLRSPAHS